MLQEGDSTVRYVKKSILFEYRLVTFVTFEYREVQAVENIPPCTYSSTPAVSNSG